MKTSSQDIRFRMKYKHTCKEILFIFVGTVLRATWWSHWL